MSLVNVARTHLDLKRVAILLFCVAGSIFFATPAHWLGLKNWRFDLINEGNMKVQNAAMAVVGVSMILAVHFFCFVGHWYYIFYNDPKRGQLHPLEYVKNVNVVSVAGSGFLTVVLAQLSGTWISSLMHSDIPMFAGHLQVYNLVTSFFWFAGIFHVLAFLWLIYFLYYEKLGHLTGPLFVEYEEKPKPE